MIGCWAEKPESRPIFSTLRQDLDDFDAAIEAKYADYDKPKYRKDKPKTKKGGQREAAMAGRVRRKK